jgi:hypothetical protein
VDTITSGQRHRGLVDAVRRDRGRALRPPFHRGDQRGPHRPADQRPRMSSGRSCSQPGCHGHIGAEGYCDTCGIKDVGPPPGPRSAPQAPAASGARARSGSVGTLVTGSARSHGTRRTTSAATRTTSRRTAIGAGLVDVPPAPPVDPASVVLRASGSARAAAPRSAERRAALPAARGASARSAATRSTSYPSSAGATWWAASTRLSVASPTVAWVGSTWRRTVQ